MTVKIEINSDAVSKLFGGFDENVRLIEREFTVAVRPCASGVEITGGEGGCKAAGALIERLTELIRCGGEITKADVKRGIDLTLSGRADEIVGLASETVAVTAKGVRIKCKTPTQKKYVKAIKENSLVFGVGPAGTGKTYLAVALAAQSYKNRETERIILTRPAIEAGEKLGFLPGDLQTKVDPYLRPLYDALSEMLGVEGYTKLIERGIIEIAPLAYMRGRTLSNAFIILDEAQNTTDEQMKMFLTRFGEGSRAAVTGDLTQIDLPPGKNSGLKTAVKILSGIEDIAVVEFGGADVVRCDLVREIVNAYQRNGV